MPSSCFADAKSILEMRLNEMKNDEMKNAEYVGYATPNNTAKELLPEETKEDKSFYPDADTMKNLEVYEKFDHKWTGIYSDLFLQFKMYRK